MENRSYLLLCDASYNPHTRFVVTLTTSGPMWHHKSPVQLFSPIPYTKPVNQSKFVSRVHASFLCNSFVNIYYFVSFSDNCWYNSLQFCNIYYLNTFHHYKFVTFTTLILWNINTLYCCHQIWDYCIWNDNTEHTDSTILKNGIPQSCNWNDKLAKICQNQVVWFIVIETKCSVQSFLCMFLVGLGNKMRCGRV